MNTSTSLLLRRWLIPAGMLAIVALVFPAHAVAPPGPKPAGPKPAGPKPAAPKPAPSGGRPAPKPAGARAPGQRPPGGDKLPGHAGKKPPLPRGAKAVRPRVRERRYWHPRYGKKPLPETWRTIGYPYYVGGTSYVVVEPTVVPSVSAERVEASPSDATGTPPPAAADDRLGELQDLIDLVHEWRTMNESAGLHKRIQAAIEMKQAAETLASIKTENEAFDKATRAAMRGLAAGRSVADALQAANTHWEELTELVESLPEPSAEQAAPGELPES